MEVQRNTAGNILSIILPSAQEYDETNVYLETEGLVA